MSRWLLLPPALALLALGMLTAVRVPLWANWKLAVLAGEYGHWLAVAAVVLVGLAWLPGGAGRAAPGAVTLVAAVAAGLLLRPAVQARAIARTLPGELRRQFGPAEVGRAPFAVAGLFAREEAPVRVTTHAGTAAGPAFDFYHPRHVGPGRVPCVVVVHGGGWDSGDRTQLPQLNHALARAGFAVAAISYRLAPQHRWPAPREDVLAAVAGLKAQADALGIDPTRFVLLGRSAGGQIAQTTAYVAGDPAIRGVVGLYAPSDLIFGYVNTHEDDMLKSPALMRQFLGGTPESARANYESASALFHVHGRAPPTLLLHGELDALVWHRHSVRLAARLAEHGVPHAFVSLPWATHAFEFNLHGPGGQVTTYALEWFLRAVTK